jgi:ABC-2 type transport system ATP-binding protein
VGEGLATSRFAAAPVTMEDMISCRNLTRRFGEFTAVNGLNLEVAAGAICAFLGPNGAGKSTTVKMMTGLLAPTSGDVIVCGLNAAANPLELKRRIGVLPEDLGLFDDLTVEEHLLLTGDIYGITRQETKARASQLLHALSLEHGRRTFAASCSHGMRKKTAFAMALLPNPAVLFLDEPFEAIDPVTAKIMRDLLQSVARHGVTVFLTSHILSMVERIAHQIVMIRKGTKVWDSTVGELPQSLEDHYFDLVETPVVEELEWLGPARS